MPLPPFLGPYNFFFAVGSSAFADSLWEHNGSVLRLVANGDQRQLLYEHPKPVLRSAGVTEGTVLFDGYRVGNRYAGTARRFAKKCIAPITYHVRGSVLGERQIVLKGRREFYDINCRATGRFTNDILVFVYLKSVPPLSAPEAPPVTSEQPAPSESDTITGTGFGVSNDGFVLTNRHVVEKCGALAVHDKGSAIIKEVDDINDLALLKIQGKTSAAAFRATSPSLGEAVFALGFPYSGVLGAGINFTGGNISSLSGIRNDSRYVQFTAPVQPGNSGGPLVDNNGLVVGVVSARLAEIEILKATGSLPQNVNFAIRGELAMGFLKANGVEPLVAEPKTPLSASEIAHNAEAYTVQVICQQRRGEARSGEGGYRVVGVDYNDVLKVRRWPSPDSRIIATLAPGTTGVEIIRYRAFPGKDTWVLIRYGAHEGWVNSRYLNR